MPKSVYTVALLGMLLANLTFRHIAMITVFRTVFFPSFPRKWESIGEFRDLGWIPVFTGMTRKLIVQAS